MTPVCLLINWTNIRLFPVFRHSSLIQTFAKQQDQWITYLVLDPEKKPRGVNVGTGSFVFRGRYIVGTLANNANFII